ncbi:unnamed protein product [Nezara viridula]|uniref:Uncharacterized protein n=1 Tax=Nezara viridula TaxID=85310 RepID=A0A9P0HBD0_NEZVI|nr:unnamed protein product [Nezara viridula]
MYPRASWPIISRRKLIHLRALVEYRDKSTGLLKLLAVDVYCISVRRTITGKQSIVMNCYLKEHSGPDLNSMLPYKNSWTLFEYIFLSFEIQMAGDLHNSRCLLDAGFQTMWSGWLAYMDAKLEVLRHIGSDACRITDTVLPATMFL